MATEDRKYIAAVFGASGFTGRYVAIELAKTLVAQNETRAMAVCGRNAGKLEEVVAEIKDTISQDVTVAIELADINDEDSVNKMCSQANVILNCVGPFRHYGEKVVKACVTTKCHYVDICGEPQFMEEMQLKYHDLASDAGVSIVGSCGFDSIPCDIGVEYLRKEFPGTLTGVESYLAIDGPAEIHYGTYESLIHSFANRAGLSIVRKAIFPKRLKYEGKPLEKRGQCFYSKLEDKWTLPFLGADASVVRRTQYFLNEHAGTVPIRYSPYFCMASLRHMIGVILFGIILQVFASFSAGRSLLLRHPRFFSFGAFSHEGPSKETIATTKASMSFHAIGRKSDDSGETTMRLKIHFPEPGYNATSIFAVQSAMTLLRDNIKYRGYLTPGAAFQGTDIINRLKSRGIKFVLS